MARYGLRTFQTAKRLLSRRVLQPLDFRDQVLRDEENVVVALENIVGSAVVFDEFEKCDVFERQVVMAFTVKNQKIPNAVQKFLAFCERRSQL